MCFLEKRKKAKKEKISDGMLRENERKYPNLKLNSAEQYVYEKE